MIREVEGLLLYSSQLYKLPDPRALTDSSAVPSLSSVMVLLPSDVLKAQTYNTHSFAHRETEKFLELSFPLVGW